MKLSPADFKQYKLKRKFYELSNLKRKMKNVDLNRKTYENAIKRNADKKQMKSGLEIAREKYESNKKKLEVEKDIKDRENEVKKCLAIKKRSNEKRLLYKKHKNGQPCLSTKMQYMMRKVYESSSCRENSSND